VRTFGRKLLQEAEGQGLLSLSGREFHAAAARQIHAWLLYFRPRVCALIRRRRGSKRRMLVSRSSLPTCSLPSKRLSASTATLRQVDDRLRPR
jgi:hypothetical protein